MAEPEKKPKKAAQEPRKSKLNISERECELLAAAWVCTQNPQLDWDKFADIAGFKNAHSARTCFGPLKKKLQDQYGTTAAAAVVKPYEWKSRTRKPKNNGESSAAAAATSAAATYDPLIDPAIMGGSGAALAAAARARPAKRPRISSAADGEADAEGEEVLA